MADIIFVACNARYSHVAFALKTLRANLSPRVYDRSESLEFTIQNDPVEAADEILQKSPKIIGLSVYLWSLSFMRQLAETIHKTRPEIRIFIGGPEVAMPEDDGTGEALMEVGEERAQGLLLGFSAGVGRGAVWC